MSATATAPSTLPRAANDALPTKDKLTVGMLAFFTLIAWTLEAYWLTHHNVMDAHAGELLNRALQLYWPADRTYHVAGYGSDKAFTLALERVNTCVTQWLQLWLIWSIVRKKHYRHVLQLTLATYTWYGTFLYYYVAHISNYAIFETRGSYAFVMFYACNAPWLIGYGWLMYDSIRTLAARLRAG
jgi:hypothetical protein